ncbi:hypothetical protein WA026_013470, partial [Henosepilachna vigintioctopunctata]
KNTLGFTEHSDFAGSSKGPSPASSQSQKQDDERVQVVQKSTAAKRITFEESRPKVPKIDRPWLEIACGRTRDQIELTEKVHQFSDTTGLKPRSLNF